jgi:hypothetical protein
LFYTAIEKQSQKIALKKVIQQILFCHKNIVSGTLSFDLLINKFIVGVNGRLNCLFDCDSEFLGAFMVNVGYVF